MQKLILDTNVIVSALISNSIPTSILYELVLTGKVETCLSKEVLAEYVEVLNRDKFSKFADFIQLLMLEPATLDSRNRYFSDVC